MPVYGDWVQPDDIMQLLPMSGGIVSWYRDFTPGWASWDDAMGSAFGGAGDEFYGPTDAKPDNYAGVATIVNPNQVGIFAFGVSRHTAIQNYPQVGPPGPLPPGVTVEYEPGGSYYGDIEVTARFYLSASLSAMSFDQVRLLSAPGGMAAAESLGPGDFPERSDWLSWAVRFNSNVAPTPPPGTNTSVAWSQSSLDVGWATVTSRMWDNPASDSATAGAGFRYTSTQMRQAYTPPRYRLVYNPTATWRHRQRQAPTGNTGGWPARQRQNGADTGAWSHRQRQTGA